MSNVGLLYVGGVLFINSLMLLGRIDGKSASVFNVFVGLLQVITPIYLIIKADGNQQEIFGAAGIFLFGFTYLYVGLTNWFGLETSGLGWYCLWVAVLALGFSYVSFFHSSDIKFGIIWLFWSYLWFLFYLVLAKNMDIARYVGKVTFVMAWITCTIPAFLGLANVWNDVSNTIAVIVAGLAALYFIAGYFTSKPSTVGQENVAS
ncbi:transporter [Siminovitchia acidinfaciens]|uniref:Transporter n=1 Tax=Siminovitchia acidinfaciens TaxID=2321395 RepID=A0A429Y1N2_9BACI|nr:AmiS/UreI family transporter [Siminovitchia acidinfaciens]RST75076.1 transporter [Siminovitchia acidinfaciens]